jgi:hypothetical protein
MGVVVQVPALMSDTMGLGENLHEKIPTTVAEEVFG